MRISDFILWMHNFFDMEFTDDAEFSEVMKLGKIMWYVQTIEKVSDKSDIYGLPPTNLFEIRDTAIIDALLANTNFKRADTKANKKYSSALSILKDFVNETGDENNDEDYQSELLKEGLKYEGKIRETISSSSRRTVIDKLQVKPSFRIVNNQKMWSRNATIAAEAIAIADYSCEINRGHRHFISKFNKQNYVEAHHLIPMKFQEQFDYSIDVHANIVSLCLVCHKKLHFNTFVEKRKTLEKLFEERKVRLKRAGIDVSIDDLYTFYLD